MADKVAPCCSAALCSVFETYTQQDCLSFQFTWPPVGWGWRENPQAFTQTEEKYVATKFEHKLHSFSRNLLEKKKKEKSIGLHRSIEIADRILKHKNQGSCAVTINLRMVFTWQWSVTQTVLWQADKWKHFRRRRRRGAGQRLRPISRWPYLCAFTPAQTERNALCQHRARIVQTCA